VGVRPLASLLLVACTTSSPPAAPGLPDGGALPDVGPPGDDTGPPPDPREQVGCSSIDVLFVIDDSASMAQEQDELVSRFPELATALHEYLTPTGLPLDYRIAVITTDPEDEGALVDGARCGTAFDWIPRYDTDQSRRFGCFADVGTLGSDFEMPLLMMERALRDQESGFFREGALRAVVIVSDEDDCSIHGEPRRARDCEPETGLLLPVQRFVDALDESGERGWALSVIAGDEDGCLGLHGRAAGAPRLRRLAELAPDRVTLHNICAPDFGAAIEGTIDLFLDACLTAEGPD